MNEHKEFMLLKALEIKHAGDDDILEELSEAELDKLKTKNVCVRLPSWLNDEMERVCALMSISKTKFMNRAIHSYVDQFDELVEDIDVWGKSNG